MNNRNLVHTHNTNRVHAHQSAKIYRDHYKPSLNIVRVLKSVAGVFFVLFSGSSQVSATYHRRR